MKARRDCLAFIRKQLANFIRGCRKRDCGRRSQGNQPLAFELKEFKALLAVPRVLI
jgi:hypothetical protein